MLLGICLGAIILLLALVVACLLFRYRRTRRKRRDSERQADLKGGQDFLSLDGKGALTWPNSTPWAESGGQRLNGGKLVAVEEGEEQTDEEQGRDNQRRVHIYVSDAGLTSSTVRTTTTSSSQDHSVLSPQSSGRADGMTGRLPRYGSAPLTPGSGGVGPNLRPFSSHQRGQSSDSLSHQSGSQRQTYQTASKVPIEFLLPARTPSTSTPYQASAAHTDACEGAATGLGDAALYSAYAKLANDICEVGRPSCTAPGVAALYLSQYSLYGSIPQDSQSPSIYIP